MNRKTAKPRKQISRFRKPPSKGRSHSWDAVADWYIGWSGLHGSNHHKYLAIPLMMDLLSLDKGQQILDLGCGAGALAHLL